MDEKRILSKIDELESYLKELEKIRPSALEEYERSIKDRRACERLLQISIETVIDIANLIVSELRLGIPSDEDALFSKLKQNEIISKEMAITLGEMKGFRNILVHKYGEVKDEIVFENLARLEDFTKFKEEVLEYISGKTLNWKKQNPL